MKHDVNSHFFHKWNERSAYLFGFWWADGNIYIPLRKSGGRKYSRFSLSSADREHLLMLKDMLEYDGPLKQTRGKKSKKTAWLIDFSDMTLVNQIMKLGGRPKKSFIFTPLPKTPKHLFRHFVRGFFDGDGSIFIRKYKNRHGKETNALSSSFTAGKQTDPFLEQFRDKLREFIPVGKKKISGTIGRKLIFNQHDTMLLCDWMYRNSSCFLERKKMVWDSFDKKRLQRSHMYFSNRVLSPLIVAYTMAGMKSLEIELDGEKDMVLIASDDSVWFTVRFRWWDIATMIWFFLWPAERRAVIYLNLVGGERVRCRAIKIASKYARLSGRPK